VFNVFKINMHSALILGSSQPTLCHTSLLTHVTVVCAKLHIFWPTFEQYRI
jgi:hypothetical protein